jgi:glycosyltransferase involved in cell wall biosynthesis
VERGGHDPAHGGGRPSRRAPGWWTRGWWARTRSCWYDDASSDATGKLADELADEDPRVVVVHHPENRKLGGALKSGFATATGDLVLYTDADLPCELIERGQGAAPAAAVRGRHRVRLPLRPHRRGRRNGRSTRSSTTTSSRWVLGVRIRDVNFAFKLVRRRGARTTSSW